ncbi:MAG TPA: ATP-binding protein [Chitinophagaceae bacterium]|nr:ATP-binding protein [Chitinophagaceae bacterium]
MDIRELPVPTADYERLEILLHGQSEILEMISRGADLPAILEAIVQWVELQSNNNFFASILLMDDEGKRLLHGAAPGLPDEYNQAIHGCAIGPNTGSCGTAAYLAETVIVEDIETDVRWKDYRNLALPFNLRACWSTPLLTKDGKVLGTFAIYYTEPKKPSFDDLQIIRLVSRTAVIAIEHKTAEEERERLLKNEMQTEKRFRIMIEQAPVAIGVIKGRDLIIDNANEALLQLWGKDKSVIGKPLLAGLPEIAGQAFPDLLIGVINSGQPHYGYEAQARLKRNGEMEDGYFNYVYAPYYEDGVQTGVQIVASEVTQQVLAKKRLEESEKRFRNLVEEAPVATAIYSGREMIVSLANDAMLKLWGKDASIIGKPLHLGLPELKGQPFPQLLDDVFTSGKAYSDNEARADLVVDGVLQPFYFNFTYKPLRDINGNVYAILNMAVDVTQGYLSRREVEIQKERYRTLATELETRVQERTRDLQRANESLERSNAELAQYAYVASHDLQEPLRKIRVFSSLLKDRHELSVAADDLLSRIIASSERMSQLINDLLEFSRLLNTGRAFQATDLNEVLLNVTRDFELSIKEKNATITIGNLPVLEAVPLQMNQLFNNLLSNSLKFTHEDRKPHITVQAQKLSKEQVLNYRLQAGREYFEIIFSDNGIGFEPHYAEQVFEVFKRLHDKHAYPGSGIGLSLCRKIVDNHQGHMFATSEEGAGTVFHIILPQKTNHRSL